MLYYHIVAGRHGGFGAITGATRREKYNINDSVASPPPNLTMPLSEHPNCSATHPGGPPGLGEGALAHTRDMTLGNRRSAASSTSWCVPCTPQQSCTCSFQLTDVWVRWGGKGIGERCGLWWSVCAQVRRERDGRDSHVLPPTSRCTRPRIQLQTWQDTLLGEGARADGGRATPQPAT